MMQCGSEKIKINLRDNKVYNRCDIFSSRRGDHVFICVNVKLSSFYGTPSSLYIYIDVDVTGISIYRVFCTVMYV